MDEDLIELQRVLIERGETLATAESLTAGGLAAAITSVAGASGYFLGGVVTYATELKHQLLGVTAAQVISAQCAEQMASGVRDLTGATWGVSTTGVAGPDLQEGQPVGTVFVGIADGEGVQAHRLELGDRSREEIRQVVIDEAVRLLRDQSVQLRS